MCGEKLKFLDASLHYGATTKESAPREWHQQVKSESEWKSFSRRPLSIQSPWTFGLNVFILFFCSPSTEIFFYLQKKIINFTIFIKKFLVRKCDCQHWSQLLRYALFVACARRAQSQEPCRLDLGKKTARINSEKAEFTIEFAGDGRGRVRGHPTEIFLYATIFKDFI